MKKRPSRVLEMSLLMCCALSLALAWVACAPQDPSTQEPPDNTADAAPAPDASASPDTPALTDLPTPTPDTDTADAGPTDTTPDATRTGGVTWYKEVLPILQKHCQGCHSEGGIGPFKLMTYEEAKAKAALIKWSVESKRMPPWMPDQTGFPLLDEKRMSDQEIKTVVSWVDGQTPKGDPADAPTDTTKPVQLEWVDTTVGPSQAYLPSKESERDDYHCVVIDPKLTQDRDLIGYQVVPGVKEIVHHVLIYPVDLKEAHAKETAPGKGYPCYGGPGLNPVKGVNRLIGGWAPGTIINTFPKGTGMRLPKGIGLVLQIHYNFDNASSAADLTKLKLQFAKEPIPADNQLLLSSAGARPLNIVAKQNNQSFSRIVNFPPRMLWGVAPHMHALGIRFKVEITTGGQTKTILHIPKWDFNWQQNYLFQTGYQTQPGDKVKITCWFDNPTDKLVTWGESTTDEMCLNYFFTTAHR